MTADTQLRPPAAGDLAWMHALNQDCVPEVGDVTEAELAALLERATFSLVATAGDRGVGFIVCLQPGADYQSPNFQFFEAQGRPHLYNDRIAIADGHRGRGIGRALYEASFAHARERRLGRVTCEVNVKPPNPASLAMHARLGFEAIEDQTDPRNGKVVRMLERPV